MKRDRILNGRCSNSQCIIMGWLKLLAGKSDIDCEGEGDGGGWKDCVFWQMALAIIDCLGLCVLPS